MHDACGAAGRLAGGTGIPLIEPMVESDHLDAGLRQGTDEMATDEAARAGDEHPDRRDVSAP